MFKKILILGVTVIMVLGTFTGCRDYGYTFKYRVVGEKWGTILPEPEWVKGEWSYIGLMGNKKGKYSIEFEAVPDTGYQVKEWTFEGEVIKDNKSNSFVVDVTHYKFSRDDFTITVEFEPIPNEEITVDKFNFTVNVDKTTAQIGDKIIVTLKLETLCDDDIIIEIPDWIADAGGNELEDILVSLCLNYNSCYNWGTNSIAVDPRPRAIIAKGAMIEKIFEFTVNNSSDLEVFSGAFFYTGDPAYSRFTQQIILKNDPIKITIEG